MSVTNRFAPGAFVGVDHTVRVDIAWAGECPRCQQTLAIVRDFVGGTKDVCDCGFSRPTPRRHAPPSAPEKKRRRPSLRSEYWKRRHAREKTQRAAGADNG
jgi:hypothetical protein